jgi:hypothetical protein
VTPETDPTEAAATGAATIRLRHLGVIVPVFINYGFLLLSDDDPHWAPLAASAIVAAAVVLTLARRRDWTGSLWVAIVFLPLCAWPIGLTAIGGLGD